MKLLDEQTARQVYEDLSVGYMEETVSRMQYKWQRDTPIDSHDTCQHVLAYHLPEDISEGVNFYDKLVKDQTRNIIDERLDAINKIVYDKAESVKQSFMIMSSNWCEKRWHFKHIHTLIQDSPQRCITWSFPILLYRDPNERRKHKFYWTSQSQLFPKITYTSHKRMGNINCEYNEVDIPLDKQMSLLFDASRVPHQIDNTGHLYLWMVYEGVVMKDGSYPSTELTLDMHFV